MRPPTIAKARVIPRTESWTMAWRMVTLVTDLTSKPTGLFPGCPPYPGLYGRQLGLELRKLRPVDRSHAGHDEVEGRAVHLLVCYAADDDTAELVRDTIQSIDFSELDLRSPPRMPGMPCRLLTP